MGPLHSFIPMMIFGIVGAFVGPISAQIAEDFYSKPLTMLTGGILGILVAGLGCWLPLMSWKDIGPIATVAIPLACPVAAIFTATFSYNFPEE